MSGYVPCAWAAEHRKPIAFVEGNAELPLALRGVRYLCERWRLEDPHVVEGLLCFPKLPGTSTPLLPAEEFLVQALKEPSAILQAAPKELAEAAPDIRKLATKQLVRLRAALPATASCTDAASD